MIGGRRGFPNCLQAIINQMFQGLPNKKQRTLNTIFKKTFKEHSDRLSNNFQHDSQNHSQNYSRDTFAKNVHKGIQQALASALTNIFIKVAKTIVQERPNHAIQKHWRKSQFFSKTPGYRGWSTRSSHSNSNAFIQETEYGAAAAVAAVAAVTCRCSSFADLSVYFFV